MRNSAARSSLVENRLISLKHDYCKDKPLPLTFSVYKDANIINVREMEIKPQKSGVLYSNI